MIKTENCSLCGKQTKVLLYKKCGECYRNVYAEYFEKVGSDQEALEYFNAVETPKELQEFSIKLFDEQMGEPWGVETVYESKEWYYYKLKGVGAGSYFMDKETKELHFNPSGVSFINSIWSYNENKKCN